MKRLVPILVIAAAMLIVGCGEGGHGRTEAETEGLYLDLAGAKYQIQMSRQLNPADDEDRGYLRGVPVNVNPPDAGETWFGIFLRVENVTESTVHPAEEFEIVDTEERTYRSVSLNAEENPFAYEAHPIPPHELLPAEDSVAGQGATAGALVLFKLPLDAFANRPLLFRILSDEGERVVDIDL